MRKLLTALRLRFTLVGNGAAAVEAYKQGASTQRSHHADMRRGGADTFDLVLMDLHSAFTAAATRRECAMPDTAAFSLYFAVPILDGLAATRAIRELVASGERPPAPIVVRN